jgi:hypothetical protein
LKNSESPSEANPDVVDNTYRVRGGLSAGLVCRLKQAPSPAQQRPDR